MSENETIADIVAEMRRIGLPRYDYTAGDMEADRWQFAERIEAAAERELHQAMEHGQLHAERVASCNCRDCVLRDTNAAKMREALCEIVLLCKKVGLSIHGDVACGIIASKARAALAAPPRNCDVGTAEEQWRRFKNMCIIPLCLHKGCPVGIPLKTTKNCELVWAQMPYEEGGAK